MPAAVRNADLARMGGSGAAPAPAIYGRASLALAQVRASMSGTVYHSAGGGRRAKGWAAPTVSPNDVLGSLPVIRDRSRAANRNDPFAKSGIGKLVSNIIGTGISPRCQVADETFRRQVHTLWDAWCNEADANGRLDFYGLQAQAVRTWLESGEAFVRLRPRRASDGLTVPMQLQILEPEFCPATWTAGTYDSPGPVVRAGIEFDAIGRRQAYLFYPQRPGDPKDMLLLPSRVDAATVVHLYDPTRAGLLRGIPHAAAVLLRLNGLDQFDDATLTRQHIQNLYTGYVTHPQTGAVDAGVDPLTGAPIVRDANDNAMVGLEPGIMQELLPGEDITFSDPPAPAQTYPDFMRQQLLAIANGLEEPYEVLTGDLTKVNDRTVRVILNDFRRRVQQWQRFIVIFQLCQPVWRAFIDRAILAGILTPKVGFALYDVKWVPQGWAYIQPVQDIQAATLRMRSAITSLDQEITETGQDPDDVLAQIAADNRKFDVLGLIVDSDPRRVDQRGRVAGEPVIPPEDREDAPTR